MEKEKSKIKLVEEILRKNREGLTIVEIAGLLKISRNTIAVALAELKLGCKKKNFIVFAFGTGIGGGIIIDGKLYLGQGYAGELGHITLSNGKYFEVTNEKNEVQALIEAMSAVEGEVWDVKTIDIGANKYFYFLFVAICILLLDVLFTINIIRI